MSSNNNQPKITSNNNQPNMDPAKVGFRVPQMYVALPWQATRLSSLNPENDTMNIPSHMSSRKISICSLKA